MVWVIFVEFVLWVLLSLVVWCLFHMFSCLLLTFELYILLVLCCAYHTHGKMSHRHFLVFLRISRNTMVVGSSWFSMFENSIFGYVLCNMPLLLHDDIFSHTHTMWYVWGLNDKTLLSIDAMCFLVLSCYELCCRSNLWFDYKSILLLLICY